MPDSSIPSPDPQGGTPAQNNPTSAPAKPLPWTWNIQRQMTDPSGAIPEWQFGFLAPDGAEIRVSFHNMHVAGKSVYYTSFFSNRNPERTTGFIHWDNELDLPHSKIVWMTITHGIADFLAKSNADSLLLDDLGDGKLKLIFDGICRGIGEENPAYHVRFYRVHGTRTRFELQKSPIESAFDSNVRGGTHEGETATSPVQDPAADQMAQHQQERPGKASGNPPANKLVPAVIAIGTDNSVEARDDEGNVIDRYQSNGPKDMLRWIKTKGYTNPDIQLVLKKPTKPQTQRAPKPAEKATDGGGSRVTEEAAAPPHLVEVSGSTLLVRKHLTANQAAIANYSLNADTVQIVPEGVEYKFASTEHISWYRDLLEQLLVSL